MYMYMNLDLYHCSYMSSRNTQTNNLNSAHFCCVVFAAGNENTIRTVIFSGHMITFFDEYTVDIRGYIDVHVLRHNDNSVTTTFSSLQSARYEAPATDMTAQYCKRHVASLVCCHHLREYRRIRPVASI